MNTLQANLKFLSERGHLLASSESHLSHILNPDPDLYQSPGKVENEGFEKNGIWYHSRRDPKREAVRQMESVCNGQTRHLIFLSAGLGYALTAALEDKRIESCLVIENNPELIFYLLSLVPIYRSNKQVVVYYCPDPDKDTLENILPFFQNKNIKMTAFYKHRAAFQSDPASYGKLENQVSQIMYKRSVNQATIIKFQSVWNKNLLLNIRQLVLSGTLKDLITAYSGKFDTIVICGAGPSLSESYDSLKKNRHRFLLIAADTSFFPLSENNIIPDVVVSADPQWVNHYFVLSPNAAKSVWLLDPVVCYQSPHYLEKIGARIFWWDSPFFMDKYIQNGQSRGEIAHGGSVSTNAFDLALKLLPGKVILIGQDLSFSSNLAHVKGSALESMIFFKNNRFGGFEIHNFRQLRAIPARKVRETIKKETGICTNDKLLVFKEWFESSALKLKNNSSPKLYNATTRGVYLNHFSHDSLDNILNNVSSPDSENPQHGIDNFPASNHFVSKDQIRKSLEDLARNLSHLVELYQDNYQDSIKILRKTGPVNQLEAKLSDRDLKIRQYSELNQILSLNSQKIILSITELDYKGPEVQVYFYKMMYLSAAKFNAYLKKVLYMLK